MWGTPVFLCVFCGCVRPCGCCCDCGKGGFRRARDCVQSAPVDLGAHSVPTTRYSTPPHTHTQLAAPSPAARSNTAVSRCAIGHVL